MLKVFVQRPIFTAMLMAAVVVFGLFSYPRIGVDQMPDVEFPVVTVTTILPGADPESIEKNVSKPLEEALNTLNGVDELRSVNLESVSQIVVTFTLDTDVDVGAQDVRDRVQATLRLLPSQIETPVVEKFDIGATPILYLSLSGPLPIEELTRTAEDVVKPALQRQAGVGSIDVTGGREREIQIVVDPQRLRGYGLAVSDVSQMLAAQSLDIPGGRVTQDGRERIVRLNAEVRNVDELRELIIASPGGAPVRVRDVADVIDGPEEARGVARSDTGSAVALTIRKQSGANTVQVTERVLASLEDLNRQLPEGAQVTLVADNARFIRSSIDGTKVDMVLGGILAVLIVLVFLRNLRSTIVTAIALPVSVIGTFAVLAALGFTFNMVTMLALTLSIGLLIDDAIVVIENIVRHLEEGMPPKEAALRGTAQIAVAVLAVTLAIVAVFIPVAFMEGMIGRMLYQFGVTVAVAVMISYAVSMTMAPMLASRLLSGEEQHGPSNRLSAWIERALTGLESWYRRALAKVLDHRAITVAVAVGVLVVTLGMASLLKFTFMHSTDTGSVTVNLELPIGSTLQDTDDELAALAAHLRALPGVASTFTTAGGGVLEEVHKGAVRVNLVPINQRRFSQEEFKSYLITSLPRQPEIILSVQDSSVGAGGGNRSQAIQFNLRGDDWQEVLEASEKVLAAMRQNPAFASDLNTTYRTGKPQYDVQVDRQRAAQLGIPAAQIGSTLRAFLGRDKITDYREGGDTYEVKLRLSEATLASPEALGQLTVRAPNGELVELRNLADIVPSDGPVQIDRQGQKRQITLLANLSPGYSLGEGMGFLTAFAEKELPRTVITDFAGMGKEMGKMAMTALTAMLLGIILMYMILAAQFESLVHPFTIMLSLPFAFTGAVAALLLSGQMFTMFGMIGVIMLMGLVVKNGILLVDFTQQLREKGRNAREALLGAAPVRLRPILMTTIAMVAGMIPVALARGDGAEMRVPMALVIIGGLITSTILTLFMVPVAYSLLDGLANKGSRQRPSATVVASSTEPAANDPARLPGAAAMSLGGN